MKNFFSARINLTWPVLSVFIAANLLILAALGWLAFPGGAKFTAQPSVTPSATSTPSVAATPSQTPRPTQTATSTHTPTITATSLPTSTLRLATAPGVLSQGLMVLSLNEGGYAHLFAYSPGVFPLTRLTNHPWNDITPAISPDGKKVAYSSRQNGYFELYILDLASGEVARLTDNGFYKAHPTWSPDGQWLAYESYVGNNFDIFILSVSDTSQPVIQLTEDRASDTSPAWLPHEPGRQIAFISNRTGLPSIWMADLDKVDNRFTQLKPDSLGMAAHPTWSPDGSHLAWAVTLDGMSNIYTADMNQPELAPRLVGGGNWPVFSPDGQVIAALVNMPNQTYLVANLVSDGGVVLPPEPLNSLTYGLDWRRAALPDPLPAALDKVRHITPTAVWTVQTTQTAEGPAGRKNVVQLQGVTAPNPYLLDGLAEAFSALRTRLANEIGWDYLSSLDNAFIPVTTPLEPGMREDWLYTGRSFSANSVPINAGWIALVREEFGAQTYWRVYLKTRYQDGSQGQPINNPTWDIEARYSGDPQIYEQGGQLSTTNPAGFWYDFTALAQAYGWERLPSLVDWRTYYPGIRFNQFVYRQGMDWQSAMLQLYPIEILITPTPIRPPTATPTITPRWMRPRTATPTASATITPTRRPTWTPISP